MNRLKFIVTTTGPLPPPVGPSPPTVCTYIQLNTCSILDCYRCMHAGMCWMWICMNKTCILCGCRYVHQVMITCNFTTVYFNLHTSPSSPHSSHPHLHTHHTLTSTPITHNHLFPWFWTRLLLSLVSNHLN